MAAATGRCYGIRRGQAMKLQIAPAPPLVTLEGGGLERQARGMLAPAPYFRRLRSSHVDSSRRPVAAPLGRILSFALLVICAVFLLVFGLLWEGVVLIGVTLALNIIFVTRWSAGLRREDPRPAVIVYPRWLIRGFVIFAIFSVGLLILGGLLLVAARLF